VIGHDLIFAAVLAFSFLLNDSVPVSGYSFQGIAC